MAPLSLLHDVGSGSPHRTDGPVHGLGWHAVDGLTGAREGAVDGLRRRRGHDHGHWGRPRCGRLDDDGRWLGLRRGLHDDGLGPGGGLLDHDGRLRLGCLLHVDRRRRLLLDDNLLLLGLALSLLKSKYNNAVHFVTTLKVHVWWFMLRVCIYSGTTCSNGMSFDMNHAPGARSIARPVDLQSSVLPQCHN